MRAPRSYDRYYQTSFNGTAPSKFSPLVDCGAGAADRLHDGELTAPSTTRSSTRSGRWPPTARSTGADGCRRAPGGASAASCEGLSGFDDPDRLDHYLNGLTNVRLKQNRYGVMHQFNYDLLRSSFLQQRMMAYYNAQCCGFAVEYQTYDLSQLGYSPVQKDNRLNFSFTLAGIGTFANFFGAMGGPSGNGRY